MSYYPHKVLVDARVKSEPYCKKIVSSLKPGIPVQYLPEEGVPEYLSTPTGRETGNKNNRLILTANKGAWLKPCPGTTGNYICCNYQILNFGTNCNMNCSYCILQAYFQHSEMTIFCNLNDMFAELEKRLAKTNRPFLRIGTGEFTDSLCIDHITGFSKIIVPFFAEADRAILELKTKTNQIENLLALEPRRKIVVSWSMNSERISRSEEHGAVSLEARLNAAAECERAGYWTGFHFDPIIIYDGWEKEYKESVDRIFDSVKNPDNIAWIILGCLRYPPFLDKIIRERFPDSMLPYGEFIRGNDNKLRYFKPLRIKVFRKMNEWIKRRSPKASVYLCMESPSVWKAALGRSFNTNKPVAKLLSSRFS